MLMVIVQQAERTEKLKKTIRTLGFFVAKYSHVEYFHFRIHKYIPCSFIVTMNNS